MADIFINKASVESCVTVNEEPLTGVALGVGSFGDNYQDIRIRADGHLRVELGDENVEVTDDSPLYGPEGPEYVGREGATHFSAKAVRALEEDGVVNASISTGQVVNKKSG